MATTMDLLPKVKRIRPDPYSAGRRAYEKGEPFDPDFGLRFAGWGTISAQCLYEAGRLTAAGFEAIGDDAAGHRRSYRAVKASRLSG
jgi:hypothetical protein